MPSPGTDGHPLRVAIVGSGPTGFYAAASLFQAKIPVEADMLERLPTPFGLVRGGVAPDHQKTKSVIKAYDRTARDSRFRFFGNVTVGGEIGAGELRRHYHAIIYCTGAQTDRRMDIPGEDLAGSHTATEFVAWYNGHPDFRDLEFDLTARSAVVVGVGNVAVDVARILCRTPEELAATDMADHAIEALRSSRVRDVHMLGRRGVAQAAFTQAEVEELGELAGADVCAQAAEVELDPLSRAAIESDRVARAKVETVQGYARRAPEGRGRLLTLRFLLSPVELVAGAGRRVAAVRVVRNVLERAADGGHVARPTGRTEEIPAGLVFRSVGYRGVAIPEVPFDAKRGVIPNAKGRVLDPATGAARRGEYVAGWIKRGPQGVIGTNKPDAAETVDCLLEDLAAGRLLAPEDGRAEAAEAFVRSRAPQCVTYGGWQRIDALESERGHASGRPRVKLTRIAELLDAAKS